MRHRRFRWLPLSILILWCFAHTSSYFQRDRRVMVESRSNTALSELSLPVVSVSCVFSVEDLYTSLPMRGRFVFAVGPWYLGSAEYPQTGIESSMLCLDANKFTYKAKIVSSTRDDARNYNRMIKIDKLSNYFFLSQYGCMWYKRECRNI